VRNDTHAQTAIVYPVFWSNFVFTANFLDPTLANLRTTTSVCYYAARTKLVAAGIGEPPRKALAMLAKEWVQSMSMSKPKSPEHVLEDDC
jgi:hypothetical protein